MSDTIKPTKPYGSIEDLPSMIELRQQYKGMSCFRFLLPKEQRQEIKNLKQQMDRITSIVEKFYSTLGSRNWVFHDKLNLDAMEEILADDPSPDEAETRLIAYYKDPEKLKWLVLFLNHAEPMRCRLDLLEKVKVDYLAGRYHAVVPVLIAQMDGVVNDVNPTERKGLHARNHSEMIAWDSVTAHHMGLSHALAPFRKGFYKTNTEVVTEVYRHGVMHGNLINYDNEIVATKAWNLLFAVADWVCAEMNPPKPPEPTPTFSEMTEKIAEHKRKHALADEALDAWQPWASDVENCDERSLELLTSARRFLDAWQRKRWDLVGKEFGLLSKPPSDNQLAGEAKELYQEYVLTGYKLRHVHADALAVRLIDADLTINGQVSSVQLRWILVDPETLEIGLPGQDGVWKLCPYGPLTFLEQNNLAIQ